MALKTKHEYPDINRGIPRKNIQLHRITDIRYSRGKRVSLSLMVTLLLVIPCTAICRQNGIVLDSFDMGKLADWNIKIFSGKSDYKVVKDGKNYVFRLRSKESSFLAYKKRNVSLKDFKFIRWKWKVTSIPANGDVRSKDRNDQAAQLYVRFPIIERPINSRFFGAIWDSVMSNDLNAHVLGYLWDTKAPVGFSGVNRSWSSMRYIIVESGYKNINKWVSEKRNIYEDYKRLFKREPPRNIEGLGVMINSNNTKSYAESFYDDFVFEKG